MFDILRAKTRCFDHQGLKSNSPFERTSKGLQNRFYRHLSILTPSWWKTPLKFGSKKNTCWHLQNSLIWRARTQSIWKIQAGGLNKSLAQAVRSILHFRWGLYLFSTKFDSCFSESSHFPDFYVRTFNFGGQYLKPEHFSEKRSC